MIEINLLPEQLRRSEGTPLPRQLTIYLGVAITLGLIFVNYHFYMKTGKARGDLQGWQQRLVEVQNEEKQLQAILAEISGIETHVDACEELYRNRTVWAKILNDLKRIVNEQGFQRLNEDGEYLWFQSMSLRKARRRSAVPDPNEPEDMLVLDGYASSKGSRRGARMVEDLLNAIVSYRPDVPPEQETYEMTEEEKERMARLLEKQEKGESLTPEETRRLSAAQEREAFRKSKKSGSIAMKGFYEFFVTREVETTWLDAMPSGSTKGLEGLPKTATKFTIRLGFKPRIKPQAGGRRRGR